MTTGAESAVAGREEVRQRRRAELAEVAYRQLAAKGLEGLRIRDVAVAAGINHATLLYYFPSKAALVDGIIDHLAGQLASPVGPERPGRAGAGGTLLERLAHELEDVRTRLRETPEIFAVLTELQLRSIRDPALRASLARLDGLWIGYLTSLVRSGVQAGECRQDVDPDQAAVLLAAVFRGIGLQALVGGTAHIDVLIDQAQAAFRDWLL